MDKIPAHLKKEFHSVKNNGIPATSIKDKTKLWWICERKHEWESALVNRKQGKGCPYCTNQKVLKGFNDLATTHPEVAAEWHPTKNGCLTPELLVYGSHKKAWWLGKCGHEWESVVHKRTKANRNCPYCSGQKVLAGFNDLASIYPDIAAEWHPTKNSILASEIHYGSNKKAWWLGKCGHEWESVVDKRTRAKRKCPVCSNRKSLTGFNDLGTTHPDIAAEWHPTKNNKMNLESFTFGSGVSVWWLGKCGHEWQAIIGARTTNKAGCPVCAGRITLPGFNDLAHLFPDIAAEWHPTKNTLASNQVTAQSPYLAWWKCKRGHEWETYVYNRGKVKSSGCPECYAYYFVSKPEKEIADWIKQFFTIKTSVRGLKNISELDIYVPGKEIAIEYNGLYWHSEANNKDKNYHYDKWLACKEQGIQLIQIWEDDWNRNPDLIKRTLLRKLSLSTEPAVYARNTFTKKLHVPEAKKFLEENHIQGFASGSYYLGLFDKRDVEKLVAVLVIKKEAETGGKTLNIIRYATALNVPGGFTKLLKHVERTYKPERIITFSDNCVSDGGLYEKNGFIADKQLPPDYTYIVRGERKHKFGYRLKRFSNDPELQYEPGLTERELAALNRLYRVWDAGKTRWVKSFHI